MKSYSSDFSRSSSLSSGNRSKMRRVEWFITVIFVLSLLIGSGVVIKASNAANLKTRPYHDLSLKELETIPGSMRVISDDRKVFKEGSSVIYMESEDSCELKKVKI